MKQLRIRGDIHDFSTPKVMAIVNLTPDSFYDGGANESPDNFKQFVDKCVDDGADILDLGAYSSRPGAEHISEEEELRRLIPKLELVIESHPDVLISIDTFRKNVAEKALDCGAHIINDITAGAIEPDILDVVAKHNVPYVLMHMKGTPQTMTEHANYEDVTKEVIGFFHMHIEAVRKRGIQDIIIDPGFGFAKNIQQNFELLSNLQYFDQFKLPLLCGISRKSLIYKSLNISSSGALTGTIALNSFSLHNGASILRVHDVKEAKETIAMFNRLNSSSKKD